MMRRLLTVIALVTASCADWGPGDYTENDLELVTAYTAKAACSCLFVMKQPEEFCRRYATQSPAVAEWVADLDAKTVDAGAVMFWGARATFVSAKRGCTLD